MTKVRTAPTYAWSTTAFVAGVDAQAVGQTVTRICRTEGLCPPGRLVDEARPDDSPLHPAFEWDDGLAGEAYRREQARRLIRCVRVKTEDAVESAPVFVRIRVIDEEGASSGYKPLASLTVEEYTQVEEEAADALRALRRRHASLQRFRHVWQAIDQLPL